MSKIEILVVRDPDGPAYLQLFVDGVASTDYTEQIVDAGAGHQLSDWVDTTRSIVADENLTPAFKAAVLAAREDPPGGNYIEDDRYPPYDLAHQLTREDGLVELWSRYAGLHHEDRDRLDYFACEQVSREFLAMLHEAGWDQAWLMHGEDPDCADGMVGDHWWVAVEDGGGLEHYDLTAQQFENVDDPTVQDRFEERGHEWPLVWSSPYAPMNHFLIPYRTITRITD